MSGGISNQQANKARSPSPVFGSPPPVIGPLRPMKSIENGRLHSFNSPDLESLSNQLVGLTNIATTLQKEMAALSRRSKDNASDLISLKEATIARDEDIRHSLRELVQGMGMLEMSSTTPPPLLLRAPSPSVGSSGGSTTFDGDFGGEGGSGGGRGGRIDGPPVSGSSKPSGDRLHIGQNASTLINKLNQSSGTTPRPVQREFGKMGMEMQILERILRDMSTKDGENRIMDFLFELKKNVGTRQGEKEIIGLIEAVRDEVLAMSEDIAKQVNSSLVPLDLATEEASKDLSKADDILRVLERVVKEIMTGKGVSDETKSTISRLNDEVQSGRLATEELKKELMALKVEIMADKGASEESKSIVFDLRHDIQSNKGMAGETKELVQEVKVGVENHKKVMEEVRASITLLKERVEVSKMAVDQANDCVADLKGDIRGSRGLVEEVKNIVAGLRENYGKADADTLKQLLEEVEKITAGQSQLQLRSATDIPSSQESAFNSTALAAIDATTSRTMDTIEVLQTRLEEFCDESGESYADIKVQLSSLLKFVDDITQNTAVNTHESREVRKLFEVIRMGVQGMSDRLASFEGKVIMRLDEGISASSVTKNFEGEETILERRQMWREIREDIDEVRRELTDISTNMESRGKHDEENLLMRSHVDESILEILKHQKRGGDILMAQGQMHAVIRDKVEEVRALVEEQVLRGILAAQKAGTDMLVTHRANGEELRGQVLSLRALVEEQVIGHIVSTDTGGDLSNDVATIKQHLQTIISHIMDKSEVQVLGDQMSGGITEVKQIVQGLVGQVIGVHNEARESVKSDIQEIRKLLDDVVGQVLEKQKGFGMGVLEVIKEVKKIVTDQSNSKTQDELLLKVDEIKRLTASSENRDSVLSAVDVLRVSIENTTATRESQEDLLGTVADIRRIVEDKAMEGNYLGALADLKEYIEEKDFLRQRQDNSINGVLVNAVTEVKRTMVDKEVGEDLLAAVTEIKAMLEEKQLVRAQQIAREDELKHQIGLIQRILEEGVIRAIVHLQRDLGDGIRGDMAEIKEQGIDVRSDVSDMKKIVEDDIKTRILDMKIMLEDEVRGDIIMVKRLLDDEVKVEVSDIKKVLGKNNLVDIESHKKTQSSVREVLEAVGDLQTDLKGQQSKQTNNFQELKFLIQQQVTSKSSETELPIPQLIQYDDVQLQEKLDKMLSQNVTSSKNLDKLPEIHSKVTETAGQIAEFMTVQNTMLQDSSTKHVEAAGQAILALEKARAERAIVETATTHLKELEVNLSQTTKALREEVNALIARKLALSSDLASMEAILAERRSELDKMSEEADAIQRRVVEGALEQSRQLMELKSQRKAGAQSLKRVNSSRNKQPVNQHTSPSQSNGSPSKRHHSMGQLSSLSPNGGHTDVTKDYYSVTGGFANRKEDLKNLTQSGNSEMLTEICEHEESVLGSSKIGRPRERSSDCLTGSGVMVEDWDDKLHGEEMGLAGPDDWIAGVEMNKGSKMYPKSLGAGLAGVSRAMNTGIVLDRRNISGASMGSIDE